MVRTARWKRSGVARRLALTVIATAVGAAAAVVTSLTADYRTEEGWRADSLDQLAAGLVMSGSTVTCREPTAGASGRSSAPASIPRSARCTAR